MRVTHDDYFSYLYFVVCVVTLGALRRRKLLIGKGLLQPVGHAFCHARRRGLECCVLTPEDGGPVWLSRWNRTRWNRMLSNLLPTSDDWVLYCCGHHRATWCYCSSPKRECSSVWHSSCAPPAAPSRSPSSNPSSSLAPGVVTSILVPSSTVVAHAKFLPRKQCFRFVMHILYQRLNWCISHFAQGRQWGSE